MTDETSTETEVAAEAAPAKRRPRKADVETVAPVAEADTRFPPTVLPGAVTELPNGLVLESF